MKATLLIASVLALPALAAASASCADEGEEDRPTPPADASSEATLDAPVEASSDAGCEDGSPNCTTPALTCEEAEWCPAKTGLDARLGLAAVWGSSATDVWAVGAAGTVLHFDGAQWKPTPSGTTHSLYSVWGSGPKDVWIVSTPSVLFHGTGFAGGAATWEPVTPVADVALVSNAQGKLLRAVWGASADDVWIGGEAFSRGWGQPQEKGWRRTTVGGVAGWKPSSGCARYDNCPSINALWGSSATDVWAVGAEGSALHTSGVAVGDGGVPSWVPFDSQSTAELRALWGSGAGDVWAVGARGTIRHFSAGAERWSVVASPTTEDLHGVWGTGPSDVWAVGDHGTLLHYDGTSFKPSTAAFEQGERPHLYGVWASGKNDVWAVGSGVVLHFAGAKPSAEGAHK